jgi:hypothetical protein
MLKREWDRHWKKETRAGIPSRCQESVSVVHSQSSCVLSSFSLISFHLYFRLQLPERHSGSDMESNSDTFLAIVRLVLVSHFHSHYTGVAVSRFTDNDGCHDERIMCHESLTMRSSNHEVFISSFVTPVVNVNSKEVVSLVETLISFLSREKSVHVLIIKVTVML